MLWQNPTAKATFTGEAAISLRTYFGRDIKLRHLRLIVAIEDAGQLSKAATLLHLSQPALSKALSEIERAIGEPLFVRSARGLVPNLRGTAMIRAARNVLLELDRVGTEIRDLAEHPTRVLTVGAMPTAAMSFLGRAIALLHERDPGLSVRVIDGVTEGLLSQLALGRLELVAGARLRDSIPPNVRAHWLFDDPMRVVVARGHSLTRRKAPNWDACAAFPWILPSPGHPIRITFENTLRRKGLAPPIRILDGLEIGLVLALLAHADAVNLMPARLAEQLQAEGRLRIIGGDGFADLGIYLATTAFVHADQERTPEVKMLMECLRRVVSAQVLA
ncbi:MAG: LysR family transcriptional regulator [Burkholderiaceae bacterium]|nr:LysR family transcriptional regulator [Burkholderiaceae bacterium]